MSDDYRPDEELSLDELLTDSMQYLDESLPSAETPPDGGMPELPREIPTPEPEEPDDGFEPDFGSAFDDIGAYDDEPEPEPAPAKRRRRSVVKKVKFPLALKLAIYFAAVAAVSVLLGRFLWNLAEDVLALNRPEIEVEVTIHSTDTLEDIAQTLEDVGAIKYKRLFIEFCKFTHKEDYFDPGVYTIKLSYDYNALVDHLMAGTGTRETVRLMIREGSSCSEIFDLLEESGVCSRAQLEQCAAEYRFDYPFLQSLPYGEYNRLEGYLFPDTYDFYLMDEPENVLNRFLRNFDNRMDEELMAAVEQSELSLHQVITMASIIEGEAANDDERPKVASVMYNRLKNWDNPLLGMDSTVNYAAKLMGTEFSLELNSPYNTYLYAGLPIGPINNPGLASIRAVLYPEETDYYYFATANDGLNRFFTNETDFLNFLNSDDFGNN